MNRLNTRQKLLAGFGAIAALVLLTSVLGLTALTRTYGGFEHYVHGPAHRMHLATDAIDAVNARAVAARNLVLYTDPKLLAAEKDAVSRAHATVQDKLQRLVEAAKQADPKAHALIAALVVAEAR